MFLPTSTSLSDISKCDHTGVLVEELTQETPKLLLTVSHEFAAHVTALFGHDALPGELGCALGSDLFLILHVFRNKNDTTTGVHVNKQQEMFRGCHTQSADKRTTDGLPPLESWIRILSFMLNGEASPRGGKETP